MTTDECRLILNIIDNVRLIAESTDFVTQPMVQMYGKNAQYKAVAFWNGEHPQNIYCGNCKHCRSVPDNRWACDEYNQIIDYCLRDGSCADWEPISERSV